MMWAMWYATGEDVFYRSVWAWSSIGFLDLFSGYTPSTGRTSPLRGFREVV